MIGGNITAVIQTETIEKSRIGSPIRQWTDAVSLYGWLDMMSGGTNHTTFNAKIESSTHVFLCDYVPLTGINAENSRAVINGQVYEITMIDNPMQMNQHYEIYLKFVGGQHE